MKDKALWQRLDNFRFEEGEVPFGFIRRLARDNGWSGAYAARVVDEYRKFAYLAMVAGHEVTPSDEVDQAWHLHLTYTRNYWGAFAACLGGPLHHGPTTGTTSDKARFDDNYGRTFAAYEAEFGEAPPADIWPPAEVRFGDAPYYRRLNTKTHLVVPLPSWVRGAFQSRRGKVLAGGLAALLVAGTMATAQAADGGSLLVQPLFWVAAVVGLGVAALILTRLFAKVGKAGKKDGAGGTGCGTTGTGKSSGKTDGQADGDGGSGCGGSGCGGCGG